MDRFFTTTGFGHTPCQRKPTSKQPEDAAPPLSSNLVNCKMDIQRLDCVYLVYFSDGENGIVEQPWVYYDAQRAVRAATEYWGLVILKFSATPELFFSWNNFRELQE